MISTISNKCDNLTVKNNKNQRFGMGFTIPSELSKYTKFRRNLIQIREEIYNLEFLEYHPRILLLLV